MVTSGKREEGGGKGVEGRKLRVQAMTYKINKLQRCIVQHRDYGQYF